ncbi:MAG: C40 family peptidase [Cyclobacteriaceae bacterium]
MVKLKRILHAYFIQDIRRGEKWLLVLGIILAVAARELLVPDTKFFPTTSEWRTEEASFTPAVFSKSDSLLLVANSLMGVPYQYAGKSLNGFDCSGFTRYVFRKVGIPLAASSVAQFQQGVSVPSKEAKPGDLVFFQGSSKVSHVGIITGKENDKTYFIHASSSRGVVIDCLQDNYFQQRLAGIRRVLPI